MDIVTTHDPLEHARELLEARDPTPTLTTLAHEVGLSPSWLQRSFRYRFGVSPAEYARARRFDSLRQALRNGSAVTDALYASGFGSGSRVYEHSDRLLGMPPARYRHGGAGTTIRYTTVRCPLGQVLVAATTRGICAVTLGDDAAALTRSLHVEFPRARVTRIDDGRDPWLSAVIRRIARQFERASGGVEPPELPPLDVTATAFQWRVWNELTRIPAGQTRSYRDVARALGEPGAARAVGQACGANRLALIVPCHRVTRADGSIGGWRWGVARKQALLDRERGAAIPESQHAAARGRRSGRAGAGANPQR